MHPPSKLPKSRNWQGARFSIGKTLAEHKACSLAVAATWFACRVFMLSTPCRQGSGAKAGVWLGRRGSSLSMSVASNTATPTCKDLRTGWHLPDQPAIEGDACAALPVPTIRIDNPEFSICARTTHTLLDNHIIGNKGYWPDCQDIVDLLEAENDATPSANVNRKNDKTATARQSKGLLVDVGANIGSCAIWAAARGYDVVAFEPKPIHIAMIKATASLRPEVGHRITLHEIGLSDAPTTGAVLVSEDANSGNSWIFNPSEQVATSVHGIGGGIGTTVSSDAGVFLGCLDDYCDQTINVLKVDTQGFESHVFRGAVGLMHKGAIKSVRFEFWPFALRKHGSDPVELLNMLVNEGFSLSEKGAKLEPAQFGALVDHLCADNNIPGCAYRFTDITGVWAGGDKN